MNRFWMFGITGLLLGSWARATDAESPRPPDADQPRVGVMVTLSVNATDAETRRITEALAQALEVQFLIDAITGHELPEVEVADDCLARRACVRDVAAALGVDQVLLLTVVRVGERFQVAITWGDGADGRTVSRVSIDIDVEQQDPGPVFAVYARRLLPDAALRPEPAGIDPDASTPDTTAPDLGRPSDPAGGDQHTGRRMTRGAWIAAGVGGAFLAGGIGFGLSARSAYQELDNQDCRTVMCQGTDIDRVESRALLADICFGAAVFAGATSAILYWQSGRRLSIHGADVAAYTTGRDTYLTIGGQF